jgi:hypothetical protein
MKMAFLLGDARAADPEGRQRADMLSRLESKIKPGYIANGSIGSDRPQTEYERTDLSFRNSAKRLLFSSCSRNV